MKEIFDFFAEINTISEESRKEIGRIIEATPEIKQLPMVARKIMAVVENPKSTAGDLEKIITSDQALTTRLLKIANSSFYGLLRKVNTLQRAILVIGFKQIKDIAISNAALNLYRSSDPLSQKLWEHAVGNAIATRMISLEFDRTEADEAFIAGLLHDLGKVVLIRAKPEETKAIWKTTHDAKVDQLEMEMETLGFSHTHMGGELAHMWNLPEVTEYTVRYHHHLREILWTEAPMELKTVIAIVGLADRYCRYLGIGFDHPIKETEIFGSPEAEFLKIPKGRMEEYIEEIKLAFYAESQIFR